MNLFQIRPWLSLALLATLSCSNLGEGTAAISSSDVESSSSSEPTLSSSSASVPTHQGAQEFNARLGKGINIGNVLEAPDEGEWGLTLDTAWFPAIASAGFQSVRIPVRWSAHAQEDSPYTIDSAWMARVQLGVDHALKNGLTVIINTHHYLEIFQEPAAHFPRLLGMWTQIAEHFADYSTDSLAYEILNEPNTRINSSMWNTWIPQLIPVMRAQQPNRVIVVGTSNWGGHSSLGSLQLPPEPNLLVTVHYYDPFEFTHQGAEWSEGMDVHIGTPWTGSAAEQAVIEGHLDLVQSRAATLGVPVNLGEFGAYSQHVDTLDQERWTAFMARSAEARGFSWHYWEFGAGFGAYDRTAEAWHPHLLRALVPDSPSL